MKDRDLWAFILLAVIVFFVCLVGFVNFWLAPVLFLILTAALICYSVENVPAKPPHKAILMFLGKRLEVVLNEGWNWVPLYPHLFSFILIKVEKIVSEFGPQKIRTPDKAVISVSESMIWVPGVKCDPASYIAFLDSGGESGITKILRERVEDRVKTWAASNKEGPSSWMEAQALKDDVHAVLAKAMLGGILEPVDNPVPTSTWMRFFDTPQSEPTTYDASPRNGWAFKDPATGDWNWDGLQNIFDGYPEDQKVELKRRIDQRKLDVKKLREGKGDFGDKSLGITILGFSVNEVEVTGEVAKAAELEEKERREQAADKMEIDNVSDRAARIKESHPDLTSEQAFRIVQVERGKATRAIIDVGGAQTGLGHDLLNLGVLANQCEGLLKPKATSSGNKKPKPAGQPSPGWKPPTS